VGTSSLRTGRVTLRVPFAASSGAVARQRLRAWLVSSGFSTPVVDDARVIVSELVANSVRHASPLPDGDILVMWEVEHRGLVISVTDGGSSSRPRKVHAGSSALAGRGMAIVESLAVRWWAENSRSRSTVHAIMAL
jgi:serine/threonine-protein kinase RsbW